MAKIQQREMVVETEKMVFGGQALARQDRFVVFVDGALPSETVRVWVYKKKKQFAFARTIEVLKASPDRVASDCPRVGDCGGCTFRHCRYDAQLRFKRQMLAESLYGVPHADALLPEVKPSPEIDFYRNKMVFTFGVPREGGLTLGLHRKGSFFHIVDASCCRLQSPESQEILQKVQHVAIEMGLPAFNEKLKTHGLRNVIIREGKNTRQRLVEVTATEVYPGLGERLLAELGHLADTLILGLDVHPQGPPRPGVRALLKGGEFIEETLGGFRFQIGPDTFFQSNTQQAERLFARVMEMATANGRPQVALDLFAGTGPIAMHLSRVADQVIAVESWEPSIRAAEHIMKVNGIQNVSLVQADVSDGASLQIPAHVDVVVVDPPRPGLEPEALEWICHVAPTSVVYVSCNPTTLARDLKIFFEKGYRLVELDAFDMFPHTFHMETVARLEKI